MKKFQIGNRLIGYGQPTYIVAEMSANHNHSFDRAVQILEAAKSAGADAVKLQTYTADTITVESDKEYFQVKGGSIWDGATLHSLYQEAYTPWEWQPKLKKIADELELDIFSSPFDTTAVDFLEQMEVPAYKIASPEIIDFPLIKCIAQTGKPIIMSTGMARLAEIDEAMELIRSIDSRIPVVLLKCTSAYPTPIDEVNLRNMPYLGDVFGVSYGLSDHTMGHEVAMSAVALGASVIEKHFTLSRDEGGPDSSFSMEPDELRFMVDAVRRVEASLGQRECGISPREEVSHKYRKSLFIVEDIEKGDLLSEKNIRSVRPGHGMHPRYLDEVLGRIARCKVEKGTPLCWELIE